MRYVAVFIATALACSPSARPPAASASADGSDVDPQPDTGATATAATPTGADVLEVAVSGEPQAYTFAVTIRSPDTGCDLYADWWEVIAEDGSLLHRRILAHSHADEQPFTRSSGPVPIQSDTRVFVRAHLAPGGYGGRVLAGSVASGFEPAPAPAGSESLEDAEPRPDGCAF